MNYLLTFCFVTITLLTNCQTNKKIKTKVNIQDKNQNYIELSGQLLQTIIDNEPTAEIEKKLQSVSTEILSGQLQTDIDKKVFWINIYNAYIQLLLMKNPELYEDRGDFFKEERITIAGEQLSFDEIEHGIIRSSKIKLSLGLLRNPFVGKFERTFRTNETDPRVHFALNCGAKSCPLVAIYQVKGFENKIDAVVKDFLSKTTRFESNENTVYITSLFSWFRGDFGRKRGIVKFLKRYNQIPKNSNPELTFTKYDWTLSLGNYYHE